MDWIAGVVAVRPNKVLLPIDLADHSANLLRQAAYVARRFCAEIVLLHVVRPSDRATEMVHDRLEQIVGSEFAGIAVKWQVVQGEVAQQIEQTARNESIDLIMMAPHSHGAIHRLALGSVTAKVLRQTGYPVWTATCEEDTSSEQFSVRRLLCAIDLGAHSARTLAHAREVANAFNAKLTLVHVTAGVEIYGPGGAVPLPDWREELRSVAAAELERLQRKEDTAFESIIDSGNVAETLNRVAQDTHADLLMIGRLPGGGHLGANGAGYALVRDSVVPVLSM